MDFDSVLLQIGEFGRYQKINYFLLCLPVLFCAANNLSYVFTAGVPNYRCFVPGCDDPQAPVYDQQWVSSAIPGETDRFGLSKLQLCERYASTSNITKTNNESCSADSFDKHDRVKCDSWVFDSHDHTIVEDYLVTCKENQWKLSVIGTLHFAGIVVGSALGGVIADWYGRKKTFITAILFMSVTGMGQAVSTSYCMFSLFAFLNAVGLASTFPLAFIIAVEMVGLRQREMAGIVMNYFYAIGEAMVGLVAWMFGDWIILQIVVSAPPILFISYYWIIPESVRWLIVKKRIREAGIIIQKAAKMNNKPLSEEILQAFEIKPVCEKSEQKKSATDIILVESEERTWKIYKQFVSSRTIVARVFIMFFIWATNAFVYYGLSVNSTSFSGNKHLNFILASLVEIPGYTLSWIAMNKIGRRWALGGSLLLCAITCMAGGFAPQDCTWLITILFLSGKLGITSSFAAVYVHTAELLPTVIRSGGVGTASTVARLGALLAPFVPLLNDIYRPLPLLLFGFTSLIAGLLTFFLPETLGLKLPDTVEEAQNLGQKRKERKSDGLSI